MAEAALDVFEPADVAHDLPLVVIDSVYDDAVLVGENDGISHVEIGGVGNSMPGALQDSDPQMREGLQRSLEVYRKVQAQREQEQVALQEALTGFNDRARLDTTTPADGHCLFHALDRGGLFEEVQFGNALTIPELRRMALQEATMEELTIAAAGCGDAGVTVEAYVSGMQAADWGDNLMIAKLASLFNRDITVIRATGARTFLKEGGEIDGAVEDAVWIGHLREFHYMGIQVLTGEQVQAANIVVPLIIFSNGFNDFVCCSC